MPATTNCVQLALHDKRLSTALLAATNKCQYLKNAEQLNVKYNILEISICVADSVKDSDMPLDISVKVVKGLVEIYLYNLKSLGRSLQLNKDRKITFKRKHIEIEVHLKNKRLKENINSLNFDNLYCLDFDNDILTDEQIIECLLTNKHQTIVRNISDITIREAPPAIAYNKMILDQDDDFGPVTDADEMEQFYFPTFGPDLDHEPVREEQASEQDFPDDGFEDCVEPCESTSRNSIDAVPVHPTADVAIQPLDDVPMEIVPAEPESLPPLLENNVQRESNLFRVPDAGTPIESATTPANNATPSLAQSMITESIHSEKTKKSVANRQTKLSAKHMDQSTENYSKLQRKRPMEELLFVIAAKKADNLHRKPLRSFKFAVCFERNPKTNRSQNIVNRQLLLQELGLKSSSNRSTKHSEPTDDVAVAAAAAPVLAVITEPIAFSANDEQENSLIGGTSEEPNAVNESYVSDAEMLSLLHSLWECLPNGLPFDMVKMHVKNRFTAASVFAHLLALSAKGIIRVTKGDNGSPQTLSKGSNWI